jgi:hypothetical protein
MPKRKCPGYIVRTTQNLGRYTIPWRSEIGKHCDNKQKMTVMKLYGVLHMLAATHSSNYNCQLAHASYDILGDIMDCTRNALGDGLKYLKHHNFISVASGYPGRAMSYKLDLDELPKNSYFKVTLALFAFFDELSACAGYEHMNATDAVVWSLMHYRATAPKGNSTCYERTASMAKNIGTSRIIVERSVKRLADAKFVTYIGRTERNVKTYAVNGMLLPYVTKAYTEGQMSDDLNVVRELPVRYVTGSALDDMLAIAEERWKITSGDDSLQ